MNATPSLDHVDRVFLLAIATITGFVVSALAVTAGHLPAKSAVYAAISAPWVLYVLHATTRLHE